MKHDGSTHLAVLVETDLTTGLIKDRPVLHRDLSALNGLFHDEKARRAMLAQGDIRVYDFFDLGIPASAGNLAFGTSIVYPGKVGDEYFMTRGHFHEVLETAEVYYCLGGHGYMLMESPEGDWEATELRPGCAVHVPARYAHRSINVSPTEALRTFFVFRGDAGHDYGSIGEKGFRKLMIERNGAPTLIDNPRGR